MKSRCSAAFIAISALGVLTSGPNATVSPASLTYSTQLVGTTSPPQSVTLTDNGTAVLRITSIGFKGANPGDFAQTNTCGSSVAPGASCTISVTFKPTGINTRSASLSITDNAPGSPQTVSLSGTGTVVELNPSSLSFFCGGTRCPPDFLVKTTTLTNTGNTPLTISGITITGQFFESNDCPQTLGGNQSCTITVHWSPGFSGFYHGAVSVNDNGGGSPQRVILSGTRIQG